MIMPQNLQEVEEQTTVVGDVDAFIAYLESGQAWAEWNNRCEQSMKWIRHQYPD